MLHCLKADLQPTVRQIRATSGCPFPTLCSGPANNPIASPRLTRLLPLMPRKVSEIVEEARQMPYGDRTELIEQLIADTAKAIDPKIEKAWGDEALRRLEEIEKDRSVLVPGEEVMARARKIIGRK